jgi:hypothetical protein
MLTTKIILTPTPWTASAGFMFETALNKDKVFEVDQNDFVSITLYKRFGAKELKKGG